MREQQRRIKQEIYHVFIVVALIILSFFSIIIVVPDIQGVTVFSTANVTIILFDDGDRDRSSTSLRPGVGEVNNLFANEQGNAGSSIYFYANYTNATGQSLVNTTGTSCAIEFDNAAGGNRGPFSMIENTTINLFEYNRTVPNYGTFWWNATCSNTNLLPSTIIATDEIRVFNSTCFTVNDAQGTYTLPNRTANTILCKPSSGDILPSDGVDVPIFNLTNLNNVTLDCNGTRFRFKSDSLPPELVPNGLHVVSLNNSKGFILKNCGSLNMTKSIALGPNVNDTLLYNNTFENMSTVAINASNGRNLTVILNNFTSSTTGTVLNTNNFNVTNFSNNNITNLQRGLEFINMHRNYVFNNTIKNNTLYGILLENSSNNTIIWNNISNNSGQGIRVSAGPVLTITANLPVFENLIANNTICANGFEGILFNNTRILQSPVLDGLVANNTFCNATTGTANREIAKVLWDIEIQVVNATNTSMQNANVNVTDTDNGTIQSNLLSNANGFTAIFNITEFIVNNSETVRTKTPTNFVGAKNSEKTNLTLSINQVRISRLNTVVILNLSQDATPPNVTQVRPTSGTETIAINFQANVSDQTGIQSCNFFSGTTNTSTTNLGAMDYNASSGVVNRTVTYGSNGGFTVYANCTDNGGNIGFNFTSISISALTSGGGGTSAGAGAAGGVTAAPTEAAEEVAAEEEEAAEEEVAPAEEIAPTETEVAAEETAQTAAQAAAAEGKSREEIIELMKSGEVVALDYGLTIVKVIANGEVVYENGEQINTITMRDEDILDLTIVIANKKEGTIEDITIGITNIPKELRVNEISPKTIEALEAGEEKTITIELESEDLEETFVLQIHAESSQASASLALSTILEAGKGAVYYTRQRIIEETKEIVTRTYKILFLLFLIPLLLLLRATTLADEKSVRRMLEDKTITNYWRIYVPEAVYPKYNVLQNLKPITIEDRERAKAQDLAAKTKIPYDLATMVLFAKQKLIPRIFTMEEVSKELCHEYSRIWFTSPLHNYKEEQLKRYIETQQAKGFSNNEIRQTLRTAQWKPEVIKKYLNPEKDIKEYIAVQQQTGKSLGSIRMQLLDIKWDKAIVDKYVPREAVAKEYISLQRRKGKDTATIRTALLKRGWEKELVSTFLNPEYDLKEFIDFLRQKGIPSEQIKKQLFAVGWKKQVIDKYLK